ncbi:HTTM domain-containing protein [Hymenobacter sp. H14-R3]|uniref:HTTM domain-containing protein n=1 Tax=Hymenobacter sp. H14-R3 TaxID=3046308 RepID=UPI0024B92A99|nr:HTTM domain-containing protein [Hymenobacter sp. H14-R3]MDJ0367125.1 HTTM domain-containing protein [Hymenobacter sp. H14-R3]
MKNSPDSHTIGLSIYRVILSFLVIKNMIFYYGTADEMFGADTMVNYQLYHQIINRSVLAWLEYPFQLPYAAKAYIFLVFVLAFLFLFGIYKRVVGTLFCLSLMVLNLRNNFILDGSDNVMQVTLPFLVLAHSYNYFVYDVRLRALDGLQRNRWVALFTSTGATWAARALMIQVCFIYFFTAIAKMQGSMWLNGTATYYTMRVEEFRQTAWNIPLTNNHYFVVLSTYFTVLWELSFAFLVWFRRTRLLVLLCGVALHVGIWFFMRIDNFSWIMIGTYFVFVTNQEYRLGARAFDRARLLVRSWLKPRQPAALAAEVEATPLISE